MAIQQDTAHRILLVGGGHAGIYATDGIGHQVFPGGPLDFRIEGFRTHDEQLSYFLPQGHFLQLSFYNLLNVLQIFLL